MRFMAMVALLLAITEIAYGQRKDAQVPFLFTQDETLPEADMQRDVGTTDALRTDAYLTAPMTRLEYILSRMEARLNEPNTINVIKGELAPRFDAARPKITDERIAGFAGYSDSHGKVIAGYTIEHLGRPRVPMREACDKVLSRLELSLPQEILGFTYHNVVLGVLAQKDHGEYTPILQKLAVNVVHRVRISAFTEDRVHYTLECQRSGKNASIVYKKYSFRVSPLPPR